MSKAHKASFTMRLPGPRVVVILSFMDFSRICQMGAVIIGIIMFPVDAFAWGPGAHIDFSMQVLSGAVALSPVMRKLLQKYSSEFLYGSLAADAVVGKNRAADHDHCHSWKVGRALLKDAQKAGGRIEAFILGYYSHLAADIVAHNHFVPGRLVACYRARLAGHLYWEVQLDHKLLQDNQTVRATNFEISKLRIKELDKFLFGRIKPTLFSHRVSKEIYHQSLAMQRRKPWQGALRRVDSRSKMPISQGEIERWRTASVAIMALALNDPFSKKLEEMDPTGRSSLHSAMHQRRMLKHKHSRHEEIEPFEIHEGKRALRLTHPPTSLLPNDYLTPPMRYR